MTEIAKENLCVPQARLDALRSLGVDFKESARGGAHVFDSDGRRYLDGVCSAGIFNLGRRPPELVEALRTAVRDTDQGNFPMISIEKAALAKAMADFVPGPLECSVFSVTRGEAMEFACKVSRGFTGRAGLLTVDGGWYGQTGFALSLCAREDAEAFGPLIPDVRTMPFGDMAAAEKCIDSSTAAVILEPIQAENHCRCASPEYLRALSGLCAQRGALLVFDETQSNFGRCGRRFAFEEIGAIPDVLILGEALGGGMFPIAATVITQRVNTFMNRHPLIHMSTFGGTDIGCRVALAALELYATKRPWENAAAMGTALVSGIESLMQTPACPVKGVAGKGLMLSLDLGLPDRARAFCRAAADNGLLLLPGQVAKHTVVLRPSLLITESEKDEILTALDKSCVMV